MTTTEKLFKLPFKEAIERIDAGEDPVGLFYDWFCRPGALERKAKSLLKKARTLFKELEITPTTHVVHFYNGCPLQGELYDEYYIDFGEKRLVVMPKSGFEYNYGKCVVSFVTPISEEITFDNYVAFKKALKGELGQRIKQFLSE